MTLKQQNSQEASVTGSSGPAGPTRRGGEARLTSADVGEEGDFLWLTAEPLSDPLVALRVHFGSYRGVEVAVEELKSHTGSEQLGQHAGPNSAEAKTPLSLDERLTSKTSPSTEYPNRSFWASTLPEE